MNVSDITTTIGLAALHTIDTVANKCSELTEKFRKANGLDEERNVIDLEPDYTEIDTVYVVEFCSDVRKGDFQVVSVHKNLTKAREALEQHKEKHFAECFDDDLYAWVYWRTTERMLK